MKKLNKILRGLLFILPLVLFFSYQPVIALGVGETMHFELSLPLIWLVIFDLVGIVMIWGERKFGGIRKGWKWLLFPAFMTLSLIWSDNLLRGVMTVGVMWLIVVAIWIMISFRKVMADDEFRRRWWKWFFGSAMVICAWCIIQCVLDVNGVSREYSLMCLGCTSRSFGFPHPNGFAIEPQFMGNLLLAPALMAAWLCIHKQGDDFKYKRSCLKLLLPCFFITVMTLFLVFSRGAIYAFIVGMMFMSDWVMVRERKRVRTALKRMAVLWGVILGAFLFALNMQGIMTQVGPTNDTYMDGVAKVLSQLSLGIIDIRQTKDNLGGVDVVENPVENLEDNREEASSDKEALLDGYVEESTEIRKMMTRNALMVWRKDFSTMMFGVGVGGAGQAMYDMGLIGWPKEIVQNEYASVLLEFGLIGVVFLIIMGVMVIRVGLKGGLAIVPVMALVVSYGVTLVFFSGFQNALQIYLLPTVIYMVVRDKRVLT